MVTVRLPFDITAPGMKHGFEQGQSPEYQSTKPATDLELVSLIGDFITASDENLQYNIGFLLGLYSQQSL